jgi:hypothetical protein
MIPPRFQKLTSFLVVIAALAFVTSCKESIAVESVSVSMRNTEVYQYPTVGGDEEGATISTQAAHYRVSEMRRNIETNWVATYVYQPAVGFVGSDYVELEIFTGSDGATPPTNTKKVMLHFAIHD